ncbi:MAG TPA: hypothetical protein VKX17_07840 [Planctomycetota bacterium]|nr:hypothetical protein [Planctomycetota bacterium]
MKALLHFGLAIATLVMLPARAQMSLEESATLRFNPDATNWAEGVITEVGDHGEFKMHATRSAYVADYVEYHKEFYSFKDGQRAALRRDLADSYRDRMKYKWDPDYEEDLSFTMPYPNFSIFDESPRYGISFPLWSYTEEPRVYHFDDLRPGDRYVVGYNDDMNLYSMFCVNPMVLYSGENINGKPIAAGHERNMINGVHIMNLSSNETNPPPRIPNRRYVATYSDYGYPIGYGYTLTVPPVIGGTAFDSSTLGTNQVPTNVNPSNLNVQANTLPTTIPPNSSLAPTLPPDFNSVNSTATTPSVNKQNQAATLAQPNLNTGNFEGFQQTSPRSPPRAPIITGGGMRSGR